VKDIKEIYNILENIKFKVGIKESIKIKLKPSKKKIASISLAKRIIYLNSVVLDKLSKEELSYIIAHELLHLKHGPFHTKKFKDELSSLFEKDYHLDIFYKLSNLNKI